MNTLLEKDGLRGNVVRSLVWGGALVLLLLPGIAMRFTEEVRWTAEDFVFAGIMLLTVCIAYELAARRARDNRYMLAAGIAVGAGFLTVWANLAVGILGSEDNPANLWFFVVPAVAMAGAAVARLRPRGLAAAMQLTAAAQFAIGLGLFVTGLGNAWVFTGLMCAAWLTAAALFARARGRP